MTAAASLPGNVYRLARCIYIARILGAAGGDIEAHGVSVGQEGYGSDVIKRNEPECELVNRTFPR